MNDASELGKIVDDGTVHVTVATPKGWRCERPGCTTDWMHTHSTYGSLEQKYVFLRRNNASFDSTPPTRLTEKEARTLLLVAGRKRIDADIERLKRGGSIFTRYGTYTAKKL